MTKFRLIQPSTRAFVREARRVPGFSAFDFVHAYVYGRWTRLYLSMGMGTHPLAKRLRPLINWIGGRMVSQAGGKDGVRFEDTYHGKVVPLAAARELVSIKEDINLGDLEHVIPYQRAREIVLQQPDHLAVMECACRAAREHPCQPMDVCLIVGEPFASFVVEHQPEKSRRITPAEAQQILEAEDRRGHVHHAFFKDAMFGRFYAICNCCACCCGALQSHLSGTPMLAASGYVARVDAERCRGCRKCEKVCKFGALSIDGSLAQVDESKCMGCGVCLAQCNLDAIQLERAPWRGEPLEIGELMKQAIGESINQ